MLAPRPKIDGDLPFGVDVLCIELGGGLLFLVKRRYNDTVAAIVVVKMEDRFVIATVIGKPGGAITDFRILDDHLRIRDRLASLVADMPLNHEPMIDLMHRRRGRRPARVKADPASRQHDDGGGCPPTVVQPALHPLSAPSRTDPRSTTRLRSSHEDIKKPSKIMVRRILGAILLAQRNFFVNKFVVEFYEREARNAAAGAVFSILAGVWVWFCGVAASGLTGNEAGKPTQRA